MERRNTVQHSVVHQELRAMANHPTADQVYDSIHAKFPSISKATVYRVLNKLVEEGEVLKVRINNGPDCFDHRVDPHYHVRCTGCGSVGDVELPLMTQVEQFAGQRCGYSITGHSLQFDGLCPACQSGLAG